MADSDSPMPADADCIVIGAGIAGLAAADRLEQAGKSTVLLEARKRSGGRLEAGVLADHPVDLGGMWVSPTQTAVHQLLERYGISIYPTHLDGRMVGVLGGRSFVVDGESYENGLGLFSRLQLGLAVRKLHRMLRQIDVDAPWEATHAAAWDQLTVAAWSAREVRGEAARRLIDFTVRAVFCAEPNELSLLFYLFYLKAIGGLEIATESGPGGAQNHMCRGGLHQIAQNLAGDLQGELRYQEPVVCIEQTSDVVQVQTERARYTARHAVMAVPPALVEQIEFSPELPAARRQLLQRQVMGSTIKVWVAYPRPFWRDKGLNGMIADDSAAFSPVFDVGPPDTDIGMLAGFIEARETDTWTERTAEERQAMVVQSLQAVLGPEAAHPIDYVERDWTRELWSRGCYGAFMPPGALTRFGPALRQPHQRIHWAGTETATVWSGYVEGAIRSGWRAADEILQTDSIAAEPPFLTQ